MTKKIDDIRPRNVKIELDGKELTLEFNLNAFAEIESEYGTIDELMGKLAEGRATTLRAVLWAGLISNHPELTLKQVGQMISLADIPTLSEKLNQAIAGGLPNMVSEENEKNG